MKRTEFICDQCTKVIGPDFNDARKDSGALEITIRGKVQEEDSWISSAETQFCSTSCAAEYLLSFAKDIVARNVIEK